MAVYRHVHIEFWQDGFVLDLTPEEKYFYMYLMTNSKTSQCGIYELPKRIMETETGYNRETVEKLILRFEDYGKILYCEETREVFLLNWMKHNRANSPKVKKCIEKELVKVKNRDFVDKFIDICNDIDYSIDTVSIVYGEKEKQKEKQKEKEKYKEKEKLESKEIKKEADVGNYVSNNISEFVKLFEENIGLVNGIASEWLIEISETVDIDLFKRALEIGTSNGSCNMGYINGIIKQWRNNNIKTLKDLNAYKLNNKRHGGDSCGSFKRDVKEKEPDLYRKPTEEELAEFRRFLETNTKL